MDFSNINTKSFVLGGLAVGIVATAAFAVCHAKCPAKKYSIPDQPLRFAQGKASNNTRMLDIDRLYQPDFVRGKVVVVTGGNRGIGLAISKELIKQGAKVYITTRSPFELSGAAGIIDGIDVQDDKCGDKLVKGLNGKRIDILINNAGYFYGPVEKIDSLNFEEEKKMIDICALGVLRITAAAVNAGLLSAGSKVRLS